MTPATMGERVADLEARMKSAEHTIKCHEDQQVESKEFIDMMKGEVKERDKQHVANQWRLNIILVALGVLIAYETMIKDHHRDTPQPQKTSQASPPAHSALPPDYDASAVRSNP